MDEKRYTIYERVIKAINQDKKLRSEPDYQDPVEPVKVKKAGK